MDRCTSPTAWLAATLLTVVLALPASAKAVEFTVVTNNFPPLKSVENGKLTGLAGDILSILMAETGQTISTRHIEVQPFAEAFEAVKTNPRTILPCVARTPSRERDLKWVGPIYSTRLGLIAPKSLEGHVNDLEDAKKLTIGTVKASAPDKLLISKGFSLDRLRRAATTVEAVHMLDRQEVDLFAFPQSPAYHIMLQEGIDPYRFEMVLELKTIDMYIGFSKDTDDALIRQIQSALDAIKRPNADGKSEYDTMVGKYFAPWL